jgi:hypothetical protein
MKSLKKVILLSFVVSLFVSTNVAMAGDCTKRDKVDWQGTISSGERVSIKEVDKHGDFYLIESSVVTGFIYKSYLKDIDKSPLVVEAEVIAEPTRYEDSAFWDLNPEDKYYNYIVDAKEKGIVAGNPDGSIEGDASINRAALAKILVEATNEDSDISAAVLESGVY